MTYMPLLNYEKKQSHATKAYILHYGAIQVYENTLYSCENTVTFCKSCQV